MWTTFVLLILSLSFIACHQIALGLRNRTITQPACFVHLQNRDFRCPKPIKLLNGDFLPSAKLTRQLKPGISTQFKGYKLETNNHKVQLCYHHGLGVLKASPMDVTLVTFGTVDRISSLKDTLSTWTGLVYVAIYITSKTDIIDLDFFIQGSSAALRRLTIHLLWAEGKSNEDPFPVNALRNLALTGVPTTHFLYADMDFVPSFGARNRILKHQDLLKESFRGKSRQLLVVPAFQCSRPSNRNECGPLEYEYNYMPVRKIKKLARFGQFDLFGGRFRGYHGATNLNKYLTTSKPYSIPLKNDPQVSINYEPYAVIPIRTKDENNINNPFMLWDEVFTAYGRNKIVYLSMLRQIFEYKFVVLSEVALFHKHHHKSKESMSFNAEAREEIVKMFKARMEYWEEFRRVMRAEKGIKENSNVFVKSDAFYAEENDADIVESGEPVGDISHDLDALAGMNTSSDAQVHKQNSKFWLGLNDMTRVIIRSTGDGQASKVCYSPAAIEELKVWNKPTVPSFPEEFWRKFDAERFSIIEEKAMYAVIDNTEVNNNNVTTSDQITQNAEEVTYDTNDDDKESKELDDGSEYTESDDSATNQVDEDDADYTDNDSVGKNTNAKNAGVEVDNVGFNTNGNGKDDTDGTFTNENKESDSDKFSTNGDEQGDAEDTPRNEHNSVVAEATFKSADLKMIAKKTDHAPKLKKVREKFENQAAYTRPVSSIQRPSHQSSAIVFAKPDREIRLKPEALPYSEQPKPEPLSYSENLAYAETVRHESSSICDRVEAVGSKHWFLGALAVVGILTIVVSVPRRSKGLGRRPFLSCFSVFGLSVGFILIETLQIFCTVRDV